LRSSVVSESEGGTFAYPLEFVVDGTPVVFVGVFDDAHHPFTGLSFGHSENKTISKATDSRFALEAW
jgi:hypothetical protein